MRMMSSCLRLRRTERVCLDKWSLRSPELIVSYHPRSAADPQLALTEGESRPIEGGKDSSEKSAAHTIS
jgi:hypothetical protein